MEEALETFKHKKYDVNIYQDTDHQQSPDEWGNTDLFLVGLIDIHNFLLF